MSHINNFDLIRLAAALQVAVTHAADHFRLTHWIIDALKAVPGVPVFFFISGYLIAQSYANARQRGGVRAFLANRALRLYPGLYACFALTLASVTLNGYLSAQSVPTLELWTWVAGNLSFLQFYNPPFLRDYGVGAINGSLWTISVEIQFYLLTPWLCTLLYRSRGAFIALMALAVAFNMLFHGFASGGGLGAKIVGVSFLPWVYMFMVGAYLSAVPDLQARVLALPPWFYIVAYTLIHLSSKALGLEGGNALHVVAFLSLALAAFRLAYALPGLSDRLLARNDVSYGVYVYHMPVINALLHAHPLESGLRFPLALLITVALALLSWFSVEKPALRFKRVMLRRQP